MDLMLLISILGVIIGFIAMLASIIIYLLDKKRKSMLMNKNVISHGNKTQYGGDRSQYLQAENIDKVIIKANGDKSLQKNKISKEILKKESIFDEIFVLQAGTYEILKYELEKDDIIKGTATEKYEYNFDFWLLSEREYSNYMNKIEFKGLAYSFDMCSAHINKKIPNSEMFYFIFEALNKRIDREIKIDIRRYFKE